MKKLKGKKPDCEHCRVMLMPGNYDAFGIIEKYSTSFFNGMGGINSDAIRTAIEFEGIPEDEQPLTYRKIITFLGVLNQRNKDKPNGQTN